MTYPFAAGDTATAALLNSLGAEVLDVVNVTTNPVITAAAFSSETDIPRMKLTASVSAGVLYAIFGMCQYGMSNTDTEANINFRHTTSVTGTYIGTARLSRPWVINVGMQCTWLLPFIPAGTNTALDIFSSIVRGTGTGNTTITGGAGVMYQGIMRIGPTTGVHRTA